MLNKYAIRAMLPKIEFAMREAVAKSKMNLNGHASVAVVSKRDQVAMVVSHDRGTFGSGLSFFMGGVNATDLVRKCLRGSVA